MIQFLVNAFVIQQLARVINITIIRLVLVNATQMHALQLNLLILTVAFASVHQITAHRVTQNFHFIVGILTTARVIFVPIQVLKNQLAKVNQISHST